MDSTNNGTSGPTIPEELTGCIGFDTLNIPSADDIIEKRIYRKIKVLASIITTCCTEFRQFIVSTGRSNYKSSGERGVVTLALHENDFDDTFRRIRECHDIFSDPEHKGMDDPVKIKLMQHAFPKQEYYALDIKHLKTTNNAWVYRTYDPNKVSILLIGMTASGSDYLYSHLCVVKV